MALLDYCSTCPNQGDIETCESQCDMSPVSCGACGKAYDFLNEVTCPHCHEEPWKKPIDVQGIPMSVYEHTEFIGWLGDMGIISFNKKTVLAFLEDYNGA